ncbi:hypothetical protein C0991_006529 [Blastosporella zonata]|nr:hypothetical protein C0991_006529 [Blastosporella zonata]
MPPPTATKPAIPARGRPAVSKPVASSTASTRAKVTEGHVSRSTSGALKSDAKSKASSSKTSEQMEKSTSTRLATSAAPKAPTPTPKIQESVEPAVDAPPEANPTPTATKPPQGSISELSASSAKAPAPPAPHNDEKPKGPVPTSDPLQVAAQLYPWLYMTSTLDACFQTAEQAAKKDLAARAQQIEEDEADIKEQKTRFHAEQAADFFDVLATDGFAQTAPRIMQSFLAHGEVCERAEAEALQLALKGAPAVGDEDDEDGDWDAPLKAYAEMLDRLEMLHTEALSLELSILKLTESSPPPSGSGDNLGTEETTKQDSEGLGAQAQILGVFQACLPVLRARIANLAMAQELVDGAQENVSISLRMESLGLLE